MPYISTTRTLDPSVDLSEWINPIYLSPESITRIKKVFQDESSIQLHDFIIQSRYDSVRNAILSQDRSLWVQQGPANACRYRIYDPQTSQNDTLQNNSTETILLFLDFITSHSFKSYLSNTLNLPVNKDGIEKQVQVREFKHGDYTLLHDKVEVFEGLDLNFCFGPTGGNPSTGTSLDASDTPKDTVKKCTTHYLTTDETLLSVEAKGNTLSLVYRDEEVYKFVKYVDQETETKIDLDMVFELEFD
jgi:hypothetical protein